MEMKFGLQMRQTQRLVMTPKLQQALKLLQVPTLELQQMLKEEIEGLGSVRKKMMEDAQEKILAVPGRGFGLPGHIRLAFDRHGQWQEQVLELGRIPS